LFISYWLSISLNKLVNYARDLSDRKSVERPKLQETELKKLTGALEEMKSKLDGKEYVEEYVNIITHELKSPISAIQGAAELIDSDMPSDVLEKFMGNIQIESHRMNDLINKLLNLVTIEKLDDIETTSKVDMKKVALHSIQHLQSSLDQSQLTVTIDIPDQSTEFNVKGDSGLLELALDNLLKNAIDFSSTNEVIRIQLIADNNDIHISVIDNGSGIPDYAETRIFDRFYSLPRANNKKSTGLGLSFVRHIINLHHGSIRITNNSEKGVTATIVLPICR